MPKTSVSANGSRLPVFGRRSLLVGLVTAAGSSALAPVRASKTDPHRWIGQVQEDAELTGLEQAFKEAVVAREAAYRHYSRCERKFFASRPTPPKALAEVGRMLGWHLPDERVSWTAADVRALLKITPDPTAKKIAHAMLKIAEAYERDVQRLAVTTGLLAAEAEHDATIQALYDVSRRIIEVPVSTIFGLAAKARVIKVWGLLDWWSTDDVDTPEQLAAQVLDALIVMAAEHNHLGVPLKQTEISRFARR
jgi:hypothetical protein